MTKTMIEKLGMRYVYDGRYARERPGKTVLNLCPFALLPFPDRREIIGLSPYRPGADPIPFPWSHADDYIPLSRVLSELARNGF